MPWSERRLIERSEVMWVVEKVRGKKVNHRSEYRTKKAAIAQRFKLLKRRI